MIPRTVIGIDPGSRATGWGIVRTEGRRVRAVAFGVIRLSPDDDMAVRLLVLTDRLDAIIAEHLPAEASMEDVFVSRNPRAALKLGQARGAALACLARRGLKVCSYPPATVKRAVTGSGRAGKEQVSRMVSSLLALPDNLPLDATDALAVAICHAWTLR